MGEPGKSLKVFSFCPLWPSVQILLPNLGLMLEFPGWSVFPVSFVVFCSNFHP
jgi:hypothetical protein